MGHMGSTTRIVQIAPRNVNSLDALPHQVKMYGNMVLIEVPGRPAMCLRCQQLGHMRRQCTTPWCRACRGFGHDSSACEQSYAARARGMRTTQPLNDFMDIEEIQETMTSQPFSQSEVTRAAEKNERDEAPANASAPGEVTTTNSSSTERVIAEERDAAVDPVDSDAAAAPCPLQKTTPEIDGALQTQSTFLPRHCASAGLSGQRRRSRRRRARRSNFRRPREKRRKRGSPLGGFEDGGEEQQQGGGKQRGRKCQRERRHRRPA
ncbi:hypothetical protein HPB48_020720 [Haemaphysalis longicornis]|uniref:CCHC-type domain-containing protein n=1 Tax=Haemaphysalis longicornis TaxID=44386 RepID=A0A9J6G6V8_HAELO|nr:hypothetical protein HPB48_020720 [Haemaphysalis longicornis]